MNTKLRTGNNHYIFLSNLPEDEQQKICRRHEKIEEMAWVYVASSIRPIDEKTLKKFAYRYVMNFYINKNFLDALLVAAQESENPRLIEAVTFVIENYCLEESFNLGMTFAKRPDAFSTDLIGAMVKGEDGDRIKCLLEYIGR